MDDVDVPVFTHRKKEAKQKCVEIGMSPKYHNDSQNLIYKYKTPL